MLHKFLRNGLDEKRGGESKVGVLPHFPPLCFALPKCNNLGRSRAFYFNFIHDLTPTLLLLFSCWLSFTVGDALGPS